MTEAPFSPPERPLVKYSDMPPAVLAVALESVESYWAKGQVESNFDAVPALIKQSVERRFGGTWHVCVGEGFGFDVSHQQEHVCHVLMGRQAVLLWKT